jgi:ankyrin repeat protein
MPKREPDYAAVTFLDFLVVAFCGLGLVFGGFLSLPPIWETRRVGLPVLTLSIAGLVIQHRLKGSKNIFPAVDNRNNSVLANKLRRGITPNQRSSSYQLYPGRFHGDSISPLHLAAFRRNPEAVMLLCSHGANVNAETKSGIRPLHIAMHGQDYEVLRALLKQGADTAGPSPLDHLDFDTWTKHQAALAVAVEDSEMLELAIEHEVTLDTVDPVHGMSPLQLAVCWQQLETVETLLSAGASVDWKQPIDAITQTPNKVGSAPTRPEDAEVPGDDEPYFMGDLPHSVFSALYLAVHQDSLPIVVRLLAGGASLRLVQPNGESAILAVIASGRPDLFEAVLPFLGDLDETVSSVFQLTPLAAVAQVGDTVMARLLLSAGAKVDSRLPGDGSTALHLAALHGRLKLIDLLIEHGAEINAVNSNGTDILCGAVRANANYFDFAAAQPMSYSDEAQLQAEVVQRVLAHGADVTAVGNEGATALHIAALEANLPALEVLIAAGAPINHADKDGFSALHFAAGTGAFELVNALLKAGADPNLRGSYGRQPLDMLAYNAERLEHEAVEKTGKLLLDAGAKTSAL